jgi:hypothetical protein
MSETPQFSPHGAQVALIAEHLSDSDWMLITRNCMPKTAFWLVQQELNERWMVVDLLSVSAETILDNIQDSIMGGGPLPPDDADLDEHDRMDVHIARNLTIEDCWRACKQATVPSLGYVYDGLYDEYIDIARQNCLARVPLPERVIPTDQPFYDVGL